MCGRHWWPCSAGLLNGGAGRATRERGGRGERGAEVVLVTCVSRLAAERALGKRRVGPLGLFCSVCSVLSVFMSAVQGKQYIMYMRACATHQVYVCCCLGVYQGYAAAV